MVFFVLGVFGPATDALCLGLLVVERCGEGRIGRVPLGRRRGDPRGRGSPSSLHDVVVDLSCSFPPV